jgi:6-phosphogluconolactonase (cycloisomerase 2 family)
VTVKRFAISSIIAICSLFFAGCDAKPGCSVNVTSSGGSGSNGVGAASNGCNPNGGVSGGGGNGSSSAFVYYLSGSDIAVAGLGSNGSLTTLNGLTAQQAGTFTDDMLVVNKKFLYVPFNDTNSVQAFTIGANGALTSITGSPFALQAAGQTDAVVSDPQGRFLFVGGESNGAISVFQINSTTGALTEAPGSPFIIAGLISADSMTVDGSGKFLYVAQSDSASPVWVFSIDQNTGALSPITGAPFALNVAQLHADSSGKFLLGVQQIQDAFGSASDQHIYVFAIDPVTGTPLSVPGSPFATVSAPFDFAIHPNGQFVYITGNDGTAAVTSIEGYELDPSTGALTPLTGSPFTSLPSATQCKFDEGGGIMICAVAGGGLAVIDVNASTGAASHSGTDLDVTNYPFAVTD